MKRLPLFLLGPVLVFHSCGRSAPPTVAATVNGRAITYAELDRQYEAQFGALNERPADDQVTFQRLEVLRTLIDNEIMLQRAEKTRIEPPARALIGPGGVRKSIADNEFARRKRGLDRSFDMVDSCRRKKNRFGRRSKARHPARQQHPAQNLGSRRAAGLTR